MPIYEEKLICPLAIRFTQEHIRPVFQDGCHDLETTIKAIEVRPGQGDYDVILSAPFPNIEIVRWYQQEERKSRAGASKYWFTLDNRRLHCLQRAAMALYPKRVAAVVEVLYAVTDGIWRKDNSSTAGKSVYIGHSMKQLTGRWDWREAFPEGEAESAAAKRIEELVDADGRKPSMKELLDAPAPPSMLELYAQGKDEALGTLDRIEGLAILPAKKQLAAGAKSSTASASEVSTGDPSTPRSASGSDVDSDGVQMVTPGWAGFPALDTGLSGKWIGEKGETYELTVNREKGSWSCARTDLQAGNNSRRFTLWYDEGTDAVWWGNLNLYVDATKMRRRHHRPAQVFWLSERDGGRYKKKFTWQRAK
jgi:hypothetical protein